MSTQMLKPKNGPKSSSHKFFVGQKVRMKSTAGLSLRQEIVFKITATLPARDGSPQYRIRYEGETYERMTTEDNLEDAKS